VRVAIGHSATVAIVDGTPAETLADVVSSGLHLDPCELNSILQAVWPLMHGPLYHHKTALLIALFKRAGYVTDGVACPTGDLTVYRGEPVASEQRGISWTTDFKVARTYAQGYSTIGNVRVVQATAPPASVLARFNFEDEAVVEPDLLDNVEVKGYMPHFKFQMTW
jgi:hypothetical protein